MITVTNTFIGFWLLIIALLLVELQTHSGFYDYSYKTLHIGCYDYSNETLASIIHTVAGCYDYSYKTLDHILVAITIAMKHWVL